MKATAAQGLNLTPQELEMLQKWRSLDRRGQKTILLTVEHEYKGALKDKPYLKLAPKE